MKKISIGVENFKRIIDHGFYYIDKTQLIEDVINQYVVTYTRPRRFGKTLNMSMLYYFFSNQEKENAYLFKDLEITKNQEAMKHQNQYPVIFITLKDMKRDTIELQIEKFKSIISSVVDSYSEILTSLEIKKTQKKLLEEYLNKTSSKSDLMDALLNISICLKQHYQKNVIILIDEYDVPLQSAYENGYYDEMVSFIRNVFSSALKTNDALEKGILTGCLRISKESIFTGLNNFNVNSIMEVKSSTCFGFTQNEVVQLLNDYQLSDYLEEVKEWYDGYLFGQTDIYNPWSTLMYVDRKLQGDHLSAISFWANTSSNSLVIKYIKNADRRMQEEFETLMQGKSITKRLKLELTYQEMDDPNNVYSFLLLTGYLKVIKEVAYSTYECVIPNREVYEIYNQSFMDYFQTYTQPKTIDFVAALENENASQAITTLNDMLQRSISYYDNQENFYHGFLIGLLQNYEVESNKESGDGRFDVALVPGRLDATAIILECKHSNSAEELRKDSQMGADQIKEKNYLEDIKFTKYEKALGYGIAFYKKQCFITKV